jgi:hypothetical protein
MPGIGIGIGLNRLRLVGGNISPTNLTASFDIPTISGQVSWVDNSGGKAQYEVYSSYNGNPYVFLGTTLAGATSYIDTTCKQNASVVYKIRAKRGSIYSDYVSASALATPLCWKTDQSTLTAVVINTLSISVGKTVTVNWGDGTSQAYTDSNSNITKNYAETGQYNIWLSGDTDSIGALYHYNQSKSYGVISNWILPSTISQLSVGSTQLSGDISGWILPSTIINFQVQSTQVSGDISGWILPSTIKTFQVRTTQVSGSLPQITEHATNAINYRAYSAYMSDSNVTVFRKAMTNFDVSSQNVTFSTANIDKLLKAAADWYQENAPTANCTYNLSGANMGIPTDGVSNVDIVRLIGYYTAAGFAATVLVRTN